MDSRCVMTCCLFMLYPKLKSIYAFNYVFIRVLLFLAVNLVQIFLVQTLPFSEIRMLRLMHIFGTSRTCFCEALRVPRPSVYTGTLRENIAIKIHKQSQSNYKISGKIICFFTGQCPLL